MCFWNAGLRVDDVIVQFNGESVATESQTDMVARFGSAGDGDVSLVVKHMGLDALLEARELIGNGVDVAE